MLLDLYRLAPLSLVFVPADENQPLTLFVPETDEKLARKASGTDSVFTFPVWWELYQIQDDSLNKQAFDQFLLQENRLLPEQYDVKHIAQLLSGFFRSKNLDHARIGIELSFLHQEVFAAFTASNPGVSFLDSTALMYRLRSIKTQQEVDYLKQASLLTEAGIRRSVQAIQPGASIGDLAYAFQIGVLESARELRLLDFLGEIGGQPALGPAGANTGPDQDIQLKIGTTVKYDMQVSVAHYHSDVGRTYISGKPTREQSRIYKDLLHAQQQMLSAILPGKRINEIYQVGRQSLDQAGLHRLSRGHFGHSVGLDSKIEEPPFISAAETTILQPGMVLAVETPCYFEGVGKFQIEDMVLITEDGSENFNTLSKEWF